jgi:hypothetical protein
MLSLSSDSISTSSFTKEAVDISEVVLDTLSAAFGTFFFNKLGGDESGGVLAGTGTGVFFFARASFALLLALEALVLGGVDTEYDFSLRAMADCNMEPPLPF